MTTLDILFVIAFFWINGFMWWALATGWNPWDKYGEVLYDLHAKDPLAPIHTTERETPAGKKEPK